ncbi:MAG: type IV secretory system conjugative DNA transfer family protein [Candidatus Magasanikbacteria bacterium]|nr:type IV secretory system conjugative DNA transfer family protein [Candidatus Magasanikbacteria bacterium]
MPNFQLTKVGAVASDPNDVCLFGQTFFRNQLRRFGIKTDDRRRHMYVIGKTGMGKTTVMENMVLNDIYKGHGVGIVDPHGDFAEKIIDFIPAHRINDVVYFNPGDVDNPIGFNILEVTSEEQKHLIAAGLMGIFKKIWPDVWSSRMEYILNNTVLALLDYPGSTLLGINRLLSDKDFRKKVVTQLTDPVIKSFWQNEFASYNDRYAQEAVAPIQNKIGQFLSASVIRNMVAQVTSTINIREIMDSQKILIMNLSKGRIGEDNSRLLGGMLITKIQLAAMERVDTPEADRKDFFLYVDEFQNFATPSFANILSEARKYRLSLIMAHQYVLQLDEVVSAAVFGNVGTIMAFRVGGGDAEALAKEFAPVFMEEDIVNLAKYHIILKLMIDGVASLPFSAMTMPPIGSPTGSREKVIRVSRERYSQRRQVVEDKIIRWSGMEPLLAEDTNDIDTTIKPKDSPKVITPYGTGGGMRSITPPRVEPRIVANPIPNQTVSLKDLAPRTFKSENTTQPTTASTIHNPRPSAADPAVSQNQTGEKKKRKRKRKRGGSSASVNGNPITTSNSAPKQPSPTISNPPQNRVESVNTASQTTPTVPPINPPAIPPLTPPKTDPQPLAPKQVIEF